MTKRDGKKSKTADSYKEQDGVESHGYRQSEGTLHIIKEYALNMICGPVSNNRKLGGHVKILYKDKDTDKNDIW